MKQAQHFLHGGQSQRRGAERIFVGSKLDNLGGRQAQLAGHFFDGTTRLVNRKVGECGIEGQVRHTSQVKLQRFQDLAHVYVLRDQIANDRDLFGVIGASFDDEIMHA
jgi:hypothetical protein